MPYHLIGQAVMVAHFGFLAYLTLGGFLAWRRRWRATIWVHLAVVTWGVSIITIGQECPLTYLENWARRHSGRTDLPGGFINTYLAGVVYPARHLTEVRLAVATAVVVSWLGWWWRHHQPRRSAPDDRERLGSGAVRGADPDMPGEAFVAGPPTVTALQPSAGPAGTPVTILGSGFTGATSVQFGLMGTAPIGGADTMITVVAPPGQGTVSVTVTTAAGSSLATSASLFTYQG